MKRLTARSLAPLVLLTAAACGHTEASLTHPIFFDCPDFEVTAGTIEIPTTPAIIPLGHAVLFVPANAVTSPVQVDVSRGNPEVASIEFTPQDAQSITFEKPVTLLMSYVSCGLPASPPDVAIYRTDLTQPARVPNGMMNPTGRFVTGTLTTLSEYSSAHPH